MELEGRNRLQSQSQQGMVLGDAVLKEDTVVAPGVGNTGQLKIVMQAEIRVASPGSGIGTEPKHAVLLLHLNVLAEFVASQHQLVGDDELVGLAAFTADIQLNLHSVGSGKGGNYQHIAGQLVEPTGIAYAHLKEGGQSQQPVLTIQLYPQPLAGVFQDVQQSSGGGEELVHRGVAGYGLAVEQAINIGSGGNQLRGHAGHAGRGSGNMTVGTLTDQLLLLEHHMGMVLSKEGEQAALSSLLQLALGEIPIDHFLIPLRRGIGRTKGSFHPDGRQLFPSGFAGKAVQGLREGVPVFQLPHGIGMIFPEQCIEGETGLAIQRDLFGLKGGIAAFKLKILVFQSAREGAGLMVSLIGQTEKLHAVGGIADRPAMDHALLKIGKTGGLGLILTGTDAVAVFCLENGVTQVLGQVQLIGQNAALVAQAQILAINHVNLLALTGKTDIPEPKSFKGTEGHLVGDSLKGTFQAKTVNRTENPGAGVNAQHGVSQKAAVFLYPQPDVVG